MLGGIDIGGETITVSTTDGTNRYQNAIRRHDEQTDSGEESFVFECDGVSYAVGTTFDEGDETATRRLFARSEDETANTTQFSREQFLSAVLGDESTATDTRIGIVERDTALSAQLERAGGPLDAEFVCIHPGMAVCYDVVGEQPDCLGIALYEEEAFGALSVGGVPVATAHIDHGQRWYSVDGNPSGIGPRAEWSAIQLETLLAELLAELATAAPRLGDPIPVAIGGSSAPTVLDDAADVLEDSIHAEIASVSVAESPADVPARGALFAAKHSTGGAVPAFAATDAYVPALADPTGSTEMLVEGAQSAEPSLHRGRSEPTQDGAYTGIEHEETGAAERDGAVTTDTQERVVDSATRTRQRLDRLGTALGRIVEAVDDESLERDLEGVEQEVTTTLDELETQLQTLEESTPRTDTVSELEATVDKLETAVAETEQDLQDIRAAIAGLDGEAEVGTTDAMESVSTGALQDNIDAVEENLSDRIESIWDKLDDINDELVDVSAQAGDIPQLEQDIGSTVESLDALGEETTTLRKQLETLGDKLETVENETVARTELQSVRTDIEAVVTDISELESEFRGLERADPATVDKIARDLDALQETVVDHARRLEGVERTVSDLDDRITQAFQDTAKAEALASLQTEISRIRETAADATDSATTATETTEEMDSTVQSLGDDVEGLRQMVDGFAESSATRSEIESLESKVSEIQARQRELQNQQPAQPIDTTLLYLVAVGLAAAGALGALVAVELQREPLAISFALFVAGPALWLGLQASNM